MVKNIKKRIDTELGNFSHIFGCYFNPVETVSNMDLQILDMSQEEKAMYAAVLKKSIGKYTEIKIGRKEVLDNMIRMNETSLQDGRTLLTERIAENLRFTGKNYIILFACDTMDIPEELESVEQISYFICSICQVKDPKAVLKYDSKPKEFRGSSTGSILASPVAGFVYPLFDKEGVYPEKAALYCRSDDLFDPIVKVFDPQEEIISPDSQLEILSNAISESLGDECTIESVQELLIQSEGAKDTKDLQCSMRDIGISEGCIEIFNDMTEKMGELRCLDDKGDLKVKTSECTMKIPREVPLKTTVIDGVTYILVPAGSDVTVNGISVTL